MKLKSGLAKAAGVVTLALPLTAVSGGTPVDAAWNCNTTNRMCLSSGTSGTGYIHDFATNDSSLVNNRYSNNSVVGDNNLSVRNRKASTTRACVYVDPNYTGGTTGYANYSGQGWVTIAYGGTSIRFRYSATC